MIVGKALITISQSCLTHSIVPVVLFSLEKNRKKIEKDGDGVKGNERQRESKNEWKNEK